MDSHIGTPSVGKTYQELKKVELVPFAAAVESGADRVEAKAVRNGEAFPMELLLPGFTPEEREIVLAGCLMKSY